MTSVFYPIKRLYQSVVPENPTDFQIFEIDCIQRIGKQVISIFISRGLVQCGRSPSNRQISNSLKAFEQSLIDKLKLKDKRQLYRLLGNYCFRCMTSMPDCELVGLQLIMAFFKTLNQQQAKQMPSSYAQRKYIYEDLQSDQNPPLNQTYKKGKQQPQKNSETDLPRKHQFLESLKAYSDINETEPKNNGKASEEKNADDESFSFEDEESNRKRCEEYFIEVVGYLLTLSSPQAQLTYIWQHLKWQGFETFYEQFMNENHEWVCTARIRFPQSMAEDSGIDYMEKAQSSKNKKKARQLACMDLLKSLYLEYPEVWMIYKHLKDEKKLVIAPLDEEKDEDEIALINDRIHYKINSEKVEKVFKHNKTDIRKMMEKISAKAELNTLLQQLPGRVTSPKIAKKIEDGNWKVPVRIEYKTAEDIQENRAPKVYEKTITFPNTKIAEEEAYMEAIIQMYQKNPDLFEKIQAIKIAKRIKDPEKKVPLLRDARVAKEGY